MLRSQKVGLKLELFWAIRLLQAFILCLFGVYNDRTSTFYTLLKQYLTPVVSGSALKVADLSHLIFTLRPPFVR